MNHVTCPSIPGVSIHPRSRAPGGTQLSACSLLLGPCHEGQHVGVCANLTSRGPVRSWHPSAHMRVTRTCMLWASAARGQACCVQECACAPVVFTCMSVCVSTPWGGAREGSHQPPAVRFTPPGWALASALGQICLVSLGQDPSPQGSQLQGAQSLPRKVPAGGYSTVTKPWPSPQTAQR